MTLRRSPSCAREVVTLATQDEHDRLAMIIMQLDMALALAKSKGLAEVEAHLAGALKEAQHLNSKLLN